MTVLSDRELRRRFNFVADGDDHFTIGMRPLFEGQIQPASIDLTLDDEWVWYPDPVAEGRFDAIGTSSSMDNIIDMDNAKQEKTCVDKADEYVLFPGELILASTAEYVEVPHDLVGVVNGKSSLARLGLLIHITAGFIDPGFHGKITLEMYNLNKKPIMLRAGKPVCQLSFQTLSSIAENPYGSASLNSKYQNQTRVTPSRYDG